MDSDFLNKLHERHQSDYKMPSIDLIRDFADNLFALLFPECGNLKLKSTGEIQEAMEESRKQLAHILSKSLQNNSEVEVREKADLFFQRIPFIYECLLKDAKAIEEGDPAAVNIQEVLCTYPGFVAISFYRMANAIYKLDVPFVPRILTEHAHSKTGIDIHPGAEIGERFFIDHGTGVVIGETTVIGNNVKLYQGVTLGALSVNKSMAKIKRHPTIEDHVVIYAGATILGGDCVIGSNSIIGGNVWLTESVPPHSVVYHRPQINIEKTKQK